MFNRLFLDHPNGIGESYWAHQRVALGFAAALASAALACLVHALVPALFETTASRAVTRLRVRMLAHRRGAVAAPQPTLSRLRVRP